VEQFKHDNALRYKSNLKPLTHLDLDKRLTAAGCIVETKKIKEMLAEVITNV